MIDFDLPVYHIEFIAEAQTYIRMGPQAGSQIRGALWKGLEQIACTDPSRKSDPRHSQHCPSCYLLTLKKRSPRGVDPPRPFTLRPPLAVRAEESREFKTGEQFSISMSLIGSAVTLFPYLCQGMQQAGQLGVGYSRGQFALVGIENRHPLTDKCAVLMEGRQIKMPSLYTTSDQIYQAAEQLPTDTIRLRFLTPTQIKHEGKMQALPYFVPLIARLLERCQILAYHYGNATQPSERWKLLYEDLTHKAEKVTRTQDNTRLVQVWSGSRRANYTHDVGGFVGEVRYEGDLEPFLPWLLWGQSLQVGKNVVKGNGWYEIA